MLATYQNERYIDHIAIELKDIILEIRNLISSAAPDATEEMHSRWLSYYFADRGGPVSAGVCQIILQLDHILLAFIHGAFLEDSHGLLEGSARYKRYIMIYSFADAPWEYIKDLITTSASFDPLTLSIKG